MRWQPSRLGLALLCALILLPGGLPAAEATPDAATLLFEENQLARSPPGTVLSYAYRRKTADDAKYGRSFDDRVRLTLEAGAKPDERTVEVELFTGQNKRPAGPFPDMTFRFSPKLGITFSLPADKFFRPWTTISMTNAPEP